MLRGQNSTNKISTALIKQKTKSLSRQQNKYLLDSFVRYSLSTSRLPHTYLPTLDVYDFFSDRSVDTIYQIPQPLVVQVFSYLYCIAGNEIREISLYSIINHLLQLFKSYYQDYVVPDDLGAILSLEKSVDFVVMTTAKSFQMHALFKENYPGAKDRLFYFAALLKRVHQENYFPAPTSVFAVDLNNAKQIKLLREMLEFLKGEDYSRYLSIKKHLYDVYKVSEIEEEDIEITVEEWMMPDDDEPYGYEVSETVVGAAIETTLILHSEPTSPTSTRKRSSSADGLFGDSKRISPSLVSTDSSVNLVEQAQEGKRSIVKRK
jgi:hypothetical protein